MGKFKKIDQLLEAVTQISAENLPDGIDFTGLKISNINKNLLNELAYILKTKNGFYAYGSALEVFPSSSDTAMTLQKWNASETWRNAFGDLTQNLLFFGQDGFGNQFCLSKSGVHFFDAETGALEFMADTLDGWAGSILDEPDFHTGSALVDAWQKLNGVLKPGFRLAPKMPFILGGKYELENLYSADEVELMQFRGELAQKIAGLPDGTKLKIIVE